MKTKTSVSVFFYGTFMNEDVLTANRVSCSNMQPAELDHYRLSISPRVNIEPLDDSVVYGSLAVISHKDIQQLYDELFVQFCIRYYPYPVNVRTSHSNNVPALCYLSSENETGAADHDYLDEMIKCASAVGAPVGYIKHIDSFR